MDGAVHCVAHRFILFHTQCHQILHTARAMVRIAVSVKLAHHRSLLRSCPPVGGPCLEAQECPGGICRRPAPQPTAPRSPAHTQARAARAVRFHPGARPGGLCAPAAAPTDAQRSSPAGLGTCATCSQGQGHSTNLTQGQAQPTTQSGTHTSWGMGTRASPSLRGRGGGRSAAFRLPCYIFVAADSDVDSNEAR